MIHNRTVAAIIPLHYGLDWIEYAMRSVLDEVDEYLVMYSPVPSHGIRHSALPCPDSREDLMEAVASVAPHKTRWYEHDAWANEGAQFRDGWQYTNADVIVKLDSDEIWPPHLLSDVVAHGIEKQAHEARVLLRHHWRSLYKAFTDDPAAPGRVYIRAFDRGETTYNSPDNRHRITHTGYCNPLDIVRYKISIHGHAGEFRKDCDWFEDVYKANRQYDCHPIGMDSWSWPADVVPPDILLAHPYAALGIIE